MAVGNNNQIEKRLWDAADEMRANSKLKSSEYSIPVLGLIFLRYADQKFAVAQKELEGKGTGRRQIGKSDYQAKGVLYLSETARFQKLLQKPEGANIGQAINDAMRAIEGENPDLKDVLPKTYNRLENSSLVELLKIMASIPMDIEGDAFGKIYEYFLGKFAMAEGQKGGEFFTPTAIVKLIVEILEPFHGRIFDPACGSGGMFVQSARFVEEHKKNPSAEISIYGQERVSETVRLCKMNLAVHGLAGDIRQGNTYYEDLHNSPGKFDFVLANPPFNVDRVDKDRLKDDPRFPLGLPKVDNANYLWIQIFYSALSKSGRAGFGNLTDYKDTIPQLFWFNAFIILSNGSEAKVGSITSEWGHFNDWKKINSEGEEGIISLETVLRGTCEPIRFLDIFENFLLFMEVRGGVVKVVPKNHQYLGVNNVIKILITTLTPTLSQREREQTLTPTLSQGDKEINYRGGYEFSGLVAKVRDFRKKPTCAEEFLWELLRDRHFLGLKFRRQHQIGDYIVDFYCDEKRLVVEVDGPVHEQASQLQKDRKRENYFTTLGFSVVRLRNETVLDNPKEALKIIAEAINPSPAGRGLDEGAEARRRLGVFWHTQGSGKSISMIFFSQKVLRKVPGNWTFVVVTDRQELDDQIYKTFANAGVITEGHCQAESSKDLRRLLTEDHRFVFTLIHKFRTEDGSPHPVLSQRDDIIVITDEAHRSQYDTLAMNMRNALPNASFLAFTGTPLIIGEEKTREVFGDYVSIYNFKQSVDDGATVPLYYENRIPELQLKDERAFKEGMDRLLEEAELDEAQEKKLEREFSREYHLITRDDRLEKIAEDIVEHFTERGQLGKGMVVSIDKATAVKMYDKVRKYWKQKIDRLMKQMNKLSGPERQDVEKKISYMRETDMAVVVSSSQNEVAEMKKKGVDILPHRQRMVKEDLDTKFKDPDDLFRLAFVCAMWMTGFDVPSCSAIYLDKPMRNHTLMQTIARANRVFKDKVNGLIVDYVGVFRNLQRALAIYGSGSGGGVKSGEEPVKAKAELFAMLKTAIDQTVQFLKETGVEAESIIAAKGFERVKLLDEAVDAVLVNDTTKKRFINLSNTVNRIYKAILPDPEANEFVPACALFRALQWKIEALQPEADVSTVMEKVEELLDESITAKGYVIREPVVPYGKKKVVDLSRINFKALKKQFVKERKRMEIEKLRGAINSALEKLVRLNKTRVNYLAKFQQMIDDYNQGAVNVEEFFNRLLNFVKELQEEEKRGVSEGLSEEELAIFDLITKPEMKLTKGQERQVKSVARELLETLKREKFVLDWRKTQARRAAVRVAVEDKLDELPRVFTREIYTQKCNDVYQHIFESYYGEGRSVYATAV